MIYGSVCSGIEAATVAWHPLGWKAAFFAEIDPFANAVLQHHYPDVPNLGDFTQIKDEHGRIDLLVGGTPCQDFSIAGIRVGMDGDRGELTLEFLRLLDRLRPRWFVWENVPGVLSADGGRAFGTFLGAMAELGYGWTYRILDAQFFGVPQRRRRVFVVGYLGDSRRSAAVLFESDSLCGNPPPCRETGQVAPTIPSRSTAGGGFGSDFDCDGGLVAGTLESTAGRSRGAGTPLPMLIAFSSKDMGHDARSNVAPTLRSMNETNGKQNGGGQVGVASESCVRRLLPLECERLQGFPDGYTLVPDPRHNGKLAADQPRYHVLGNSFAVPVVRWIGQRIQMLEELLTEQRSIDVHAARARARSRRGCCTYCDQPVLAPYTAHVSCEA